MSDLVWLFVWVGGWLAWQWAARAYWRRVTR